MNKYFNKIISIVLIFGLLFAGSGFAVVPQVKSQSTESPTSAPQPSQTPSDPKPTSEPKPTSVPVSSDPAPTPVPSPSSDPQPTAGSDAGTQTAAPSPTGSDSPISDPTPTEVNSPSQTGSDSSGDGSSSGQNSVNDPANIGTGPLSTNNASEKNQNWEEVLNNNLAQMQNKIDAVSSSGFNYANFNTLQGQVFTGNSVNSLNLLNKLNSTMTGVGGFSVFNVYDTYAGDIVFKYADANSNNSFSNASSTVSKNSVTGPGSLNNALADNSFTVKEANGNDAKLENNINLQAVTGGNSASYNTGGGTIKTGNATALGNILNMVNTNLNVSNWLIGVVNIFGTLAGNIVLPQDTGNNSNNNSSEPVLVENSSTGPLSDNNASSSNTNSENLTNNNDASITSNLDVSANTGSNSASINTGGGSVKSGNSDASVTNTTVANTNKVEEDGTVWMVIVNEMGRWVGYIIGAPWGATVASNSLPITQTDGGTGTQTYSTISQNTDTGPLSSNNAAYNNSTDFSSTTNNSAEILNNITANADTGSNKAEYNTGAGDIQTGNAKVGLNLVNMVNTNIVAKKFVAVLVNVLGSFLGNVVTPDQNYNSQVGSNSQQDNSPFPIPTISLPSFSTATANIGGIASVQETTSSQEDTDNQQHLVSDTYDTSMQNFDNTSQTYSQEYNQAVKYVSYAKNRVYRQAKILSAGVPIEYIPEIQVNTARGSFISPAFAKATQPTITGILLGGATFKINDSWLSVIPIAFLIVLLRRKRKFDFSKYLNLFLELVL